MFGQYDIALFEILFGPIICLVHIIMLGGWAKQCVDLFNVHKYVHFFTNDVFGWLVFY